MWAALAGPGTPRLWGIGAGQPDPEAVLGLLVLGWVLGSGLPAASATTNSPCCERFEGGVKVGLYGFRSGGVKGQKGRCETGTMEGLDGFERGAFLG